MFVIVYLVIGLQVRASVPDRHHAVVRSLVLCIFGSLSQLCGSYSGENGEKQFLNSSLEPHDSLPVDVARACLLKSVLVPTAFSYHAQVVRLRRRQWHYVVAEQNACIALILRICCWSFITLFACSVVFHHV